ncbi:MAG: hypothetical protein EZS28_014277, partial [Streblomastix strix]
GLKRRGIEPSNPPWCVFYPKVDGMMNQRPLFVGIMAETSKSQ